MKVTIRLESSETRDLVVLGGSGMLVEQDVEEEGESKEKKPLGEKMKGPKGPDRTKDGLGVHD